MRLPKDLNRLIGRKVFYNSNHLFLKNSKLFKTNKKYEIIDVSTMSTIIRPLVGVIDEEGDKVYIHLNTPCPFLLYETEWKLAPASKSTSKPTTSKPTIER